MCEVCSYLQLSEWKTLRLACRHAHESSLRVFLDQYFKSVRFIATSDGLRELEEMSKSARIRERVQQLWMIPTLFYANDRLLPFTASDYRIALINGITADELKSCRAKYQAIMSDNIGLLESETFSDRLCRCLASFTGLETIGLLRYASTFLLDARQQKVRFLGWCQLRDQVDFRFARRVLVQLEGRRTTSANYLVLSRLFQALAGSGQKISKLELCHPDYRGTLYPEIALTQVQYSSLLFTLSELEDLRVCLSILKPPGREWPEPCDTLTDRTWLNLMIKIGPCLKKLVLT